MARCGHSPRRTTVAWGWAIALILIAGCATPTVPPNGPSAIVLDNAVRSVLFPSPSNCKDRKSPCPGQVPAEYAEYFRQQLAAAGFNVIDSRGRTAPVIRIFANHVGTTATGCAMEGSLIIADSSVEVKRTYPLPAGTFSADPAGRLVLAPGTERAVLRSCLAAFARTSMSELR